MTRKQWGLVLLLAVAVAVAFYFDLIVYGLRQLSGQWHIISNARPVEEFLNDPQVSDGVKNKLRLVADVRRYAIDRLGLSDTDNYTEMYDQQGQPVLWVVTGCEPYALAAHQWRFPVLGSMPYKGFFKLEYAEQEAEKLRQKGLDVNIRTVGGWSTLGWFKDPILSEMLKREHGRLASLIIHELVHATIFVKDSVVFNENLASFIADKGTDLYMEEKYGSGTNVYDDYYHYKHDRKALIRHMLGGLAALDTLYNSEGFVGANRESQKQKMIATIMYNLDTIPFRNKNYLKKIRGRTVNNAYFMSFKRYQSKQNMLDSVFDHRYNGDLIRFVEALKSKYAVSL